MEPMLADILTIFATAVGLLVLASLIGVVLRRRLSADGTPHPTVETYVTRVHSWWAMVLLTSVALLSGKLGVVILFAFCAFAALREFLTLSERSTGDHWSLIAAFYVILPAQFALVYFGITGIFSILIPVYAFLFLPMLSVLRGPEGRFLARISQVQWALMIAVYCGSHVPALATLDIAGYEGRSVLLIAFLVLVVQLGDLMDYFAGRRIGKHRIAAAVSPRTYEGFVAGALVAAVAGFLFAWVTPFSPLVAAAMAVLAFTVGTGGSLVLRAIKRDLGVRDFGHLIPGQGGFIDQLDSVIFAAPVFFHVTRFFFGS